MRFNLSSPTPTARASLFCVLFIALTGCQESAPPLAPVVTTAELVVRMVEPATTTPETTPTAAEIAAETAKIRAGTAELRARLATLLAQNARAQNDYATADSEAGKAACYLELAKSGKETDADPTTDLCAQEASLEVPLTTSYTWDMFAKPKRRLPVTDEDTTLDVEVTSINWQASRWISDRYDGSYHYRDVMKGHAYVTLDFQVTTEAKDPKLPVFRVFRFEDGRPVTATQLSTALYRWQSHSSYLGTYSDNKNDFKYTSTVRFTAGAQIPKELLKQPLFLVARRDGCQKRAYDRWANPPVSYSGIDCFGPNPTQPDAFWTKYHVVAVHRGGDLKKLLTAGK